MSDEEVCAVITAPSELIAALAEGRFGQCYHEYNGWGFVTAQLGDRHRWHQRYLLVVCDPAQRTWGIPYGVGLTEDQENELPWENSQVVQLIPVTSREVTTLYWETMPCQH
jgi:hypothetical protein